MKTEIIASTKCVLNAKKIEMIIVTTTTGSVVWLPKSQFDATAETISFVSKKAGEDYTSKDGLIKQLKSDRNEFTGSYRQIVQKLSAAETIAKIFTITGTMPVLSV